MKESYIIRQKKERNFTTLPNEIFKSGMTMQAIGLLCFLLHLPDDWRIVKTQLHNNFSNGRDATTRAFNELIKNGYITVEDVREKGKFSHKNFYVHETPLTGKPLTDKPSTGKPSTENPTLLNTNSKQELINQGLSVKPRKLGLTGDELFSQKTGKENTPPGSAATPPKSTYQHVIDIYWDWFKERNGGVPPKIDGIEGKGAKQLVAYLETVSRNKAGDEVRLPQDVQKDVCDMFSYILNKWSSLEPFMQKQVKISQINSNITNIINYLKNGTKTQSAHQRKQDREAVVNEGVSIIRDYFAQQKSN